MGYHLSMSDAIQEPDSRETGLPATNSKSLKRLRFSIRFLLLATLVSACVFAWVNQRIKECSKESGIVEELQADGIKIAVIPHIPNQFEKIFGQRLSKRTYDVQLNPNDIDSIHRLTKLEHVVSISSSIAHYDLYAYSHFANLESLKLSCSYHLETLGGIEKLQNLKSLSLNDVDRIESCKPLVSLKNLQNLELDYDDDSKLKDLDEVNPQLSGLKSFTTDIFDPDSFECFAGLENLEELDLQLDFSNATSLDGLDKAPNLKKLSLVYCSKITDFKALNAMSAMTDLYIKDANVESIEFLRVMKNLKSLALQLDPSKINPDIAPLEILQNLGNLQTNFAAIEEMQSLSSLSKLKKLTITGSCSPAFDFAKLSELPQLKILQLSFANNLQSLDGIESLTGLDEFGVMYCHDLSNIRALRKLQQLKKIRIWRCIKLPKEQVENLISWLNAEFNVQ